MTLMPPAVLALPSLSQDIPLQFVVPGAEALTVPLTIALLEANVISDAMLRTPRNALLVDVFGEQEKQLAARALSHWWTRLIRSNSCKFFRWSLQVQQMEDTNYEKASTAWFCLSRIGDEIPRFALGPGIDRLELLREGFGQTVLAVLRAACMHLPESLNPWTALDWADHAYWRESRDDAELLEIRREEGGHATVQELLESEEVITRAKFFAEMPEWVCSPRRVLSRDSILEAGSSDLARRVIKACDEIHALVSRPGFVLHPVDRGVYRCGKYNVDGCMVLLWKQHDVIGQAIDDYLEQIGSSGEYTEFIDASPVPMTAEGIRHYITVTEQTLQLAVLTEQLIQLIGEKF